MPPPDSTSNELIEQLSRNSTPYHDPLVRVNWEALSREQFWLPEDAVSLRGLPAYDALPVERRRALSQYEFLNFIEGGLWLEGIFMQRISLAAGGPCHDLASAAYRLHELREEAGHSLMFLELMKRANMPLARTRFRRFNLANLLGRYAPPESPGFWMAVMVGEEVPDRMNRFVRKHREEVCPTIYDMVTAHVIDEARHIAHARGTLDRRLERVSRLRLRLWQPVLEQALRYFVRVFYFPGPRVYELAGLSPGSRWAKAARDNPQRIRFVDDCVRPTLRLLAERGVHLRWR
ncbi:MAG TPA: diiron oxygenase [Gammaproteobacteria bacterium]|nr:diiron oxygenase [Gammaproteobacteria bacterium]